MHQLIQAAIEAAKIGETDRAKSYLKQVISENPNGVDGWLVMAAVWEDSKKTLLPQSRVDP